VIYDNWDEHSVGCEMHDGRKGLVGDVDIAWPSCF
jgi:hypothetical protein